MTPRVLMLISNFYPVLGGAEQQALNLSRMLVKKNIPVSVLTRSQKKEKSFERIHDIPVHRSIHVLDRGKLFGVSYILSTLYHLFKLRQNYNIIHCHIADGLGHMAALVIGFFFNKKVIVKIALSGPSSDFKRMKKSGLNRLCLRMLHRVDKIITICSWSRKEALAEGFRTSQISFIPNGVDIEHFYPHEKTPPSSGRITCLGRLSAQKGIDTLIQAFSGLAVSHPALTLHIIGEGPEKTSLMKMAETLGIKDKVLFHGNRNDPYPLLIKSGVFVLPSRSEGLPNVLLEAMACGLPVVATKVGGNLDLIQQEYNGILVDTDHQKQLCSAIEKLLDNRTLSENLGRNARQTIVLNYSMDQITSQYIKLYNSLIEVK